MKLCCVWQWFSPRSSSTKQAVNNTSSPKPVSDLVDSAPARLESLCTAVLSGKSNFSNLLTPACISHHHHIRAVSYNVHSMVYNQYGAQGQQQHQGAPSQQPSQGN